MNPLQEIMQLALKQAAERAENALETREILPIQFPSAEDMVVGAWLINDTTNLMWGQYLVSLIHLREEEGPAKIILVPGMTHEWICGALHPDTIFTTATDVDMFMSNMLRPINMGYQFIAESDAAALERIDTALHEGPSVDTDYRPWWNKRFNDGVSLQK